MAPQPEHVTLSGGGDRAQSALEVGAGEVIDRYVGDDSGQSVPPGDRAIGVDRPPPVVPGELARLQQTDPRLDVVPQGAALAWARCLGLLCAQVLEACAHRGLAGAASRAAESDLTARAIGGAIRQTGASLDAARDGDAIGAGAGLGQPATVDADLVRDCAGSSGGDACACHEPIVSPAPFKS